VEKASHCIEALCRNLEVTRQGYYAWRKRPRSSRVQADAELSESIRQVFKESGESYGSPRVRRELRARGAAVSKRRVERAMRAMGLTPPMLRKFRRTTLSNPTDSVAPNSLDRNFTASRPNERWVTDITYVWTAEGWAYLAVILDLFSRAVVGWQLDSTLETSLVDRALDVALTHRRPEPGLLHHSDRGCQYTSHQYRARLADQGITVSMSRKGNCWDNAVAESFFATLKKELIHRSPWTSRNELRAALFEYLEIFYNRRRLHSFLDYKTPAQFEQESATAA
jgi:transposase InsO family protein